MYKDRDNKQSREITTSDGDTSEYFVLEDLPVDREVEQGSDHEEERASDEAAPETDTSSPVRVLRRSTRPHKPNPRYISSLDYLLLTDSGEPECYDEAMEVSESAKWKVAMQE